MKKALLKILLFLAPMVAGFVFIEVWLTHVPNIYNKKRADLEAQLNDIEVVVLGASHAFFDLNPAYFSHKGFNLASTHQSEFYDMKLEQRYAGKMPKLRLAIVSVDFNSFFLQLHETEEEWRDYYYYQFWNIKYPGLPLLDARKFSKLALYGPQRILDSVRTSGLNIDLTYTLASNGWASYKTSSHYPVNDSTGKLQVATALTRFNRKNLETVSGYIEQTVRDLRSKNITVALVSFPVFHTYSDNCPEYIVALEDSIVQSLCGKYQCTYCDYSRDQHFKITDFADNDHIFPAASTLFSKIVDTDIIQKSFQQ